MPHVDTRADTITTDDIAHLPGTAQRYLRFTRVPGRPVDLSLHATVRGHFRLAPDRHWMASTSEQRNDATTLGRDFRVRLRLAHVVPVRAADLYAHGHGWMRATAPGVFTVVDGGGPEFRVGELAAFLDDAVVLAPSMLLRLPVAWTAVDDHTFGLTLTDRGVTVTAHVTVDDRGAPREFSTEDRWAHLPGGPVRARWSTSVDGWCPVAGRMRPRRGTAVWHLPDGPFTYAQFDFANADVTCGR